MKPEFTPPNNANSWSLERGRFSIADPIEAKPIRDRVQIAPRIVGDVKQPSGMSVNSAVMVSARNEELSK